MFSIIVAVDEKNGIACDNKIPWHAPEDLAQFKKLTTGNVVVMGRKTYESIGKPLPNRENIIISKTLESKDIKVFKDAWDCVRYCSKLSKKLFVIGGQDIYDWFLTNELIDECLVTRIPGDYKCDRFYNGPTGKIENKEELAVLSLMREVLDSNERTDRTGVGCRSLFGKTLEFDLQNNKFPLLTTKKMFLRGIFEELMFYLRGQTDNGILLDKKINVWAPNTTREFLDSKGLQDLPAGDLGHSYGFSFRHYGGKYIDCKTDYTGVGFDQLSYVINEIKTNPTSRRIIIDLWEPNHMHRAALPPCLYNYQFYVSDGLSCMMTQRSSDIFTAGGWNIATGALLTIMIASVCGLKPKKLMWNIGDVHVYNNLIEQTTEQIGREPYPFPKLFLTACDDIEKFQFENLELVGYKSHPAIKGVIN